MSTTAGFGLRSGAIANALSQAMETKNIYVVFKHRDLGWTFCPYDKKAYWLPKVAEKDQPFTRYVLWGGEVLKLS